MAISLIIDKQNEIYSTAERMLYENLKKKLQGRSLCRWLIKNEIKEVILYAITKYTELFILDVESEGYDKILCEKICDQQFENYKDGYMNRTVISIKELVNIYREHKEVTIIVCSLYHCNEIFEDLMCRGIPLKNIISLSNVLINYE